MGNSLSVAVMGDIMIDIDLRVPSLYSLIEARGSDLVTEIHLTQGGSAANTASWLSVCGNRVLLLGAVGQDIAGMSAVGAMEKHGVIPLFKIDPEAPTGMCIVITEPDGSRTMLPSPGSNSNLRHADLDSLWPKESFEHFHLSAYSLFHEQTGETALGALIRARSSGVSISLDPASHALIPRHKQMVLHALKLSNILLANQEEAEAIYRSATSDKADLSPSIEDMLQVLVTLLDVDATVDSVVVVTLGAAGAVALAKNGVLTSVPSLPIDAISSTAGAGDAFNAGFLHEWVADHGDLQSALQGGVRTAVQALTRVGASPSAEN